MDPEQLLWLYLLWLYLLWPGAEQKAVDPEQLGVTRVIPPGTVFVLGDCEVCIAIVCVAIVSITLV